MDMGGLAGFGPGLAEIVGANNVITDQQECKGYLTDWTGVYRGRAIAVVRPGSTAEVAAIVKLCSRMNVCITPQGGNTSVSGGSVPAGVDAEIVLSLQRMREIRAIDLAARTVTVEAGVVLDTLRNEVAKHGLIFPLFFGARGSCTLGGNLATNAGGSNVLRYGNTRDLCVGIEAVMADGTIVNNLTGLRKDNTGYDLRHLLIGSEGTLAIITAAVLKLFPQSKVRTTAFLSLRDLDAALDVLNHLQDRSGGLVEAFEYMPANVVELICKHIPSARSPLQNPAETGILVELASTRACDALIKDDGSVSLTAEVADMLAELMERGLLVDAHIAMSEQQRLDLWTLRESILEALISAGPRYSFDAALPLANVPAFMKRMDAASSAKGFASYTVGHLGDGNLHYALLAQHGRNWADLPLGEIKHFALDLIEELSGTFSAEHGIGQSKRDLLAARKQPSQLTVMRQIKRALDPEGLLNPGKVLTLDI